MLKKLPF